MSILSDALRGRTTFLDAAHKTEDWLKTLIGKNPQVQATATALQADVKQGLSDGIAAGQTAVGDHYADLVSGGEALLETALAKVTGGASIPFNPLISAGLDDIAAIAKHGIDLWLLRTKAELASQAGSTITIGTGTAAASAAKAT